MNSFDDLLSQVPMDQVASRLGVDEATATNVVQTALPALLGGLQAQSGNPQSEQTIQGLVDQSAEQHPDDLLAGGVDLDKVDTATGSRIVDDVFGAEKNTVINTLGATGGGANSDLVAKVLPMLAPIVLAYLGKKMVSGGGTGGAAAEQSAAGGGIGDILGGLLGGAGKSGGIGGAIADALGKNSGGVLGSVLGGLLGGKR